jgi:transposase-like protein
MQDGEERKKSRAPYWFVGLLYLANPVPGVQSGEPEEERSRQSYSRRIFYSPDHARDYLEQLRWPRGPECPHCGAVGGHYALQGKAHRPGLWKCRECREQFSVTVGTAFEGSKVGLHQWLHAVHLLSSFEGINNRQLQQTLGVSYKTAWFMSQRIRSAVANGQLPQKPFA